MSVCLSVRELPETDKRIYSKFTPMMDNISGGAQKNFGDHMSKIKVTRGQKVNKRSTVGIALSA